MRWKIPLAVWGVLLAGVGLEVRAEATFFEKLGEIKKKIDANESKQLWKKINWAADMDAALKRAQKEDKPVMVFMLVNESGKKDAARC